MKLKHALTLFLIGISMPAWCASADQTAAITVGFLLALLFLLVMLMLIGVVQVTRSFFYPPLRTQPKEFLQDLDQKHVDSLLSMRKARMLRLKSFASRGAAIWILLQMPSLAFAQTTPDGNSLFSQSGILITLVLIAIPLVFAVVFLMLRVRTLIQEAKYKRNEKEAQQLADYLLEAEEEDIDEALQKRKASVSYQVPSHLIPNLFPEDARGIVNAVKTDVPFSMVSEKKRNGEHERVPVPHGNLILWYLGTAVFWLLFGTSVGEYLGIKFVAPEVDSISWLSFGRLRPVHTNAVFWGWSSLAMLGLAYYVVPIVSNAELASRKLGWISLVLINAMVILGSLSLMAGINNAGGEYREYVWPVMSLFGLGLVLSLYNFLRTIASRQSKEIYISNWYIVSAIIFTLVIAFVAYWPSWQNGLGETIVQGYYMHQGVGMWFMLFNLGLVYYFLPQQVNKPIYSYGLGILAFWSQIIFYTLIGTHHFVFSSIPWWLQTVAIVGSAGMIIPVVAGTTNFFMTFKGSWHKVSSSYTLPFFLVGILFYFTGSLQGTAEAFRFTNLLWHFTDFTVAHSHLTMYGIIAFLLWGGIYVLVPRITGKEPSQLLTGIHFWMAFIGLMFYTIPLMIGGTLKGLMWMEGRFFIESVTLMAPYWLWRAIGGTLMWISHIVFAINFYRMVVTTKSFDVRTLTLEKLKMKLTEA